MYDTLCIINHRIALSATSLRAEQLYQAKHIVLHSSLHRSRPPILQLQTSLASPSRSPLQLKPQFFVEFRHSLLRCHGLLLLAFGQLTVIYDTVATRILVIVRAEKRSWNLACPSRGFIVL